MYNISYVADLLIHHQNPRGVGCHQIGLSRWTSKVYNLDTALRFFCALLRIPQRDNHRIFSLELPDTFWSLPRSQGPNWLRMDSSCLGFRVEIILSTGQSIHYAWADRTHLFWNVYMVVTCLWYCSIVYTLWGEELTMYQARMQLCDDSLVLRAGKLAPAHLLWSLIAVHSLR